jgi:hypothetical protein
MKLKMKFELSWNNFIIRHCLADRAEAQHTHDHKMLSVWGNGVYTIGVSNQSIMLPIA